MDSIVRREVTGGFFCVLDLVLGKVIERGYYIIIIGILDFLIMCGEFGMLVYVDVSIREIRDRGLCLRF